MSSLLTLSGLFAVAFAAGSLLPLQSEAVLVALLAGGRFAPWLLVAVAGAGNTLGATLNWWLGTQVARFRGRRWFPVSAVALERAQARYHRHGRWSLLFSWMPVIGDPLTLAAGLLREPLPAFIAIVGVAKTARYAVLAVLLQWYG